MVKEEPPASPAGMSSPGMIDVDYQGGSSSRLEKASPLIHNDDHRHHSITSTLQGKNQLSTLMGVYIPCMLSILGAILFLRLSWAVGQAGFFGVVGIFLIAGSAVFLTSLSISAISTNGSMGGGGAYFMISRSIGPEFGGAVGIIFYFANAFGTTFYLVAFADNIVDTFLPNEGVWTKVMIASIALFMTLCAAYIGADFFSKLNAIILCFIALSITTVVLTLFAGFGCHADQGENANPNFSGVNATTLRNNLYPNFGPIKDDTTGEPLASGEMNSFFRVFGIVFPAMTGIMAGANLSGDLKDPGRSIGKGTISAIFSSLAIYLSLAFLVAWTIEDTYLKENTQALVELTCWTGGKYLIVLGIVCSTLSSGLGALSGAARVFQAFCADFSQIGESNNKFGRGLVGVLKFFEKGTAVKNEPRRAVILTWIIAQALLLLGSLDLLASIITNCFLLTYFFTNFACFVLKVSGAPNFRPKFKYFSWHTALLGAILNIVIMFLASPIFATVSIVLMLIVFGVIFYSAPEVPWGDISQALIFHQVRKYLLRLDERKAHPKFWRPSILLLIDNPRESLRLIDFCNNLKKGGMYILGDVLTGDLQSTGSACHALQQEWSQFIRHVSVKAFAEVVLACNFRSGAQTLMISAGLGGLKPNTIVMPFLKDTDTDMDDTRDDDTDTHDDTDDTVDTHALEKTKKTDTPRGVLNPPSNTTNEKDDATSASLQRLSKVHESVECATAKQSKLEFVGIIKDALFLKKNLLVACNFDLLDKDLLVTRVKYGADHLSHELLPKVKKKKKHRDVQYIDIWFTDELDLEDLKDYTGNLSLMMQLAFGLNRTDIWQECTTLRFVNLLKPGAPGNKDRRRGPQLEHQHTTTREEEEEEDRRRRRLEYQDTLEAAQRERMASILEEARVEAEIKVLSITNDSVKSMVELTNDVIRKNVDKTSVLFLNLPFPPDVDVKTNGLDVTRTAFGQYVSDLKTLTRGLPPTVLTLAGQTETVIATEI